MGAGERDRNDTRARVAGAAVAPYEAPAVLLSLAPCRPGRLLASSGAKLDRPQTRAGQRDAEGGERRGDAGAARERRGAQRLRKQHLKLTAVAISQRPRASWAHAHAWHMYPVAQNLF